MKTNTPNSRPSDEQLFDALFVQDRLRTFLSGEYWLPESTCIALNDAANAMDPSTLSGADGIRDELVLLLDQVRNFVERHQTVLPSVVCRTLIATVEILHAFAWNDGPDDTETLKFWSGAFEQIDGWAVDK